MHLIEYKIHLKLNNPNGREREKTKGKQHDQKEKNHKHTTPIRKTHVHAYGIQSHRYI